MQGYGLFELEHLRLDHDLIDQIFPSISLRQTFEATLALFLMHGFYNRPLSYFYLSNIAITGPRIAGPVDWFVGLLIPTIRSNQC